MTLSESHQWYSRFLYTKAELEPVKNRQKNGEFFEKQFLEKITPNMR
jgi:hypothetical protein